MKIQIFDFSINVLKSLLWRHNNAVNLQALLQNKQDALDELNQDFWESWVNDVFNLQTANKFGLMVWSIILSISLTIDDVKPATGNNFGLGEFRRNFYKSKFVGFGDSVSLTIEEARTVLKLKYYQLVTRGTIPECNKIVADVFDHTNAPYALDGLDMTMTYVFLQPLTLGLRSAVEIFDLLPRPSGVEVKIIYS